MGKLLHVLMIEDSEDESQSILRALKEGGYDPECTRAETAQAILDALREKPWDMILAGSFRLKALFENMNACAAIYEAQNDGTDFVCKDCNRSVEITEKTDRNNLIGKSVLTVFPGARDSGLLDALNRVWRTGRPEQIPAAYYQNDRIQGWREHHINKLPNGEIAVVYHDVTERKDAEKKILDSEEKYRLLVENGREVIIIAQKGVLKFVNRSSMEMFGPSFDSLTSTPFTEFVHPDDREMVLSYHQRRLAGEAAPSRYTFRVITKTGIVRWAEIRSTAVTWEGEPATLSFLTDITKRRLAEEKLKESEERFRALFDHSRDCVYVIDLAGNFIEANPSALNLLGYERTDIPELNIISLLHETDLARGIEEFEEIIRTGFQNLVSDHTLKCKDGRLVHVETQASVVYRNGKPHSILGIARDTTERRMAETQLRNYANEISELYNNAPCGYHSLAADGSILRMNDTELKWLGYARDEIVGVKNWRDLLTPESQPRFQETFSVFQKQGWISDLEFNVVRKDGSVFPVLLNATAIKDKEGRFIQSSSTIFDVTQLKKVQSELSAKNLELTGIYEDLRQKQAIILQQEKMASIGMLSAGVAHEIKNPLAIILQGINYLQSTVKDDAHIIEVIERLNKAVLRADTIVKDLLSFARQTPGLPVKQDILALIDEALTLTDHEFRSKNIRVIKEYPPDLPKASVDGNQIKQVFVNLIINAIDAMPQRGQLTVSIRQVIDDAGKDVLQISFKDTGHGIPADKIRNIFDPFYTTKTVGNTGLGLSISKGIIDMHGGIIYAESYNKEGANFIIQLH